MDENDERPFCTWCKTPLKEKCKYIENGFAGTNIGIENQLGLLRFSHEGCGLFKFIVVSGPLKGTIWSGNPGDDPYLSKDKCTFLELLNRIYSE